MKREQPKPHLLARHTVSRAIEELHQTVQAKCPYRLRLHAGFAQGGPRVAV